jgi:hypothetical protein
MKRTIAFMFLCLSAIVTAQAQKFNWVKPVGSTIVGAGGFVTPTQEHPNFLCTDSNKNLYAACHVGDSSLRADTFFRASSIGPNIVLNSASLLLASYTCEGKMRWARLIESTGEVISSGLVYQSGSIYIAGRFGDTGTNRYRYIAGVPLLGHDSQFYFLARYDTLGNLRWIRFVGANDQQIAIQGSYHVDLYDDNSFTLDGQGNLHFVIYFRGGVKLTPGITTQTGIYDVSFDTAGSQLGAVRLGVDSTYRLYDQYPVHVRAKNTVCISKKSGKMFTVLNRLIPGSPFIYGEFRLCAFAPNGQLLWEDTLSRSIYQSDLARIRDAVYDEDNGIYVSGDGKFGQFALSGVGTTYPGRTGSYLSSIIKVDTNGKPRWVYANQNYGNIRYGELGNTTLLPNGNILAVGFSAGVVNHYKDSITYPVNTGGPFYTIIKPNGDFVKMGAAFGYKPNNGSSYLMSATVDKAGNIYFGGVQWNDSLVFPGGIYNVKYKAPFNVADGYIARFGIDCRCTGYAHSSFKDSVVNEKSVYFTYTGTTEVIDSIVWYFGGGQKKKVTSGYTTPFIRSYASGAAYSRDSVLVVVYSGCGVDSSYRYPPPVVVGVAGLSALSDLRVYPNPTHTGSFKVILESTATIREAELILTDITGRQVYERRLRPNAITIDEEISVQKAVPGVYILEVRAGNERMVRRVVVE